MKLCDVTAFTGPIPADTGVHSDSSLKTLKKIKGSTLQMEIYIMQYSFVCYY